LGSATFFSPFGLKRVILLVYIAERDTFRRETAKLCVANISGTYKAATTRRGLAMEVSST
jgi:hypothetical protein